MTSPAMQACHKITIPSLKACRLNELLDDKVYGAVDSNLQAWLDPEVLGTQETTLAWISLDTHKDNQELIDELGGHDQVMTNQLFSFIQITHLIKEGYAQTNGMSNLFFTQAGGKLFIIGVVYDKTVEAFVPYIYRVRNKYRAWTRGNRLFIKH